MPQIALVAVVILTFWLGFDRLAGFSPSLAKFKALPDFGVLLAIVAPAPLFGLANFMLGSAGLNFMKDQSYYLGAILVTGVISLIACFALSGIFGAVGAAIAFVGAEFILLLLVISRYKAAPSDAIKEARP